MPRPKTLREKIEHRMARKAGEDVFLTREFTDLGGEDQVLRALRGLMKDGHLVRLGYGVYGRAFKSRLSGRPVLRSSNGFISAARQASISSGWIGSQRNPSGHTTRDDQRRSPSIQSCA